MPGREGSLSTRRLGILQPQIVCDPVAQPSYPIVALARTGSNLHTYIAAAIALPATLWPTVSLQHGRGRRELSSRRLPLLFRAARAGDEFRGGLGRVDPSARRHR